jgi:transcriptional regulator with XRE-family HTH domain
MRRRKRPKPQRLGAKLKAIREKVGITQDEIVKRLQALGADETLHSGYVADYETNGSREPSLLTLLAYSKLSGISINVLVDDELDYNP